ncbi:MAG: hypothetical protein GYA24_25210 [Candidatus Lokiarchaeota archaeon]|nr:hypothetical protein [Candidatus Lokiarchaeota archaeon]
MSSRDQKKKFLEQFHDLVKHYEQVHEEHEWKQTRVQISAFYKSFLQRFDDVFRGVINPLITEKAGMLRKKAEELSAFDERGKVHDLAEKMVQRLNDLGMQLYAIPDIEYVMESSREIELNVLMTCCPGFVHEKTGAGQKLCCEGTVKTVKFGVDQDIQPAVRLYYEKHCRDCQRLAAVQEELAAARKRVRDVI